MRFVTIRMRRYHYQCDDCGRRGELMNPSDRGDAVAVHARSCSGVVRQWDAYRETGISVRDVDLANTFGCPWRGPCAICGTQDDVMTGTAETRLGVFCLRLCGPCADRPIPACRSAVEAMEKVLEHCEHLGISADDMAAVMEYETRSGRGGYR